ncbi:MAG: hypothetical protein KDB72_20970 [Mycobacterium sp.]|nr:hypothetical protein [Mycobacterium sp.]
MSIEYQISDYGISLDESGLPDYSLVAAETANGQEHFVLVYRPGISDANCRYDWLSRHARHEQLGQLPQGYRALLGHATQCDARTKTGRRCTRIIDLPETRCSQHRTATGLVDDEPMKRPAKTTNHTKGSDNS